MPNSSLSYPKVRIDKSGKYFIDLTLNVVIEMNFTRFLKDSTIMGAKNRTATYILRKKNDKFKISALIPHTPISD